MNIEVRKTTKVEKQKAMDDKLASILSFCNKISKSCFVAL
jgi:hypothetical protein